MSHPVVPSLGTTTREFARLSSGVALRIAQFPGGSVVVYLERDEPSRPLATGPQPDRTFPLGAARTREEALTAALADLRALAAAIASTR